MKIKLEILKVNEIVSSLKMESFVEFLLLALLVPLLSQKLEVLSPKFFRFLAIFVDLKPKEFEARFLSINTAEPRFQVQLSTIKLQKF